MDSILDAALDDLDSNSSESSYLEREANGEIDTSKENTIPVAVSGEVCIGTSCVDNLPKSKLPIVIGANKADTSPSHPEVATCEAASKLPHYDGSIKDADEEAVPSSLTKARDQLPKGPASSAQNPRREKGSGVQESIESKHEDVPFSGKNKNKPAGSCDSLDEADVDALQHLLSEMAKVRGAEFDICEDFPLSGMEASQLDDIGEDMVEAIMKEMESMSQSQEYDDVMNGMVKELMCKDVMYEPMREVMERFPRWLAENKGHLSEVDYNRYGRQYQCFQRIVALYESDPDNFPRLMELIQDAQEFGQPPEEIIRELAPNLKFDKDGLPKIDGEQCSIM